MEICSRPGEKAMTERNPGIGCDAILCTGMDDMRWTIPRTDIKTNNPNVNMETICFN